MERDAPKETGIEPAKRLYLSVARRLQRDMESGVYPAGSRLPPERELAERLSVSRPVVREALIVLEIRGHLTVRPNGGVVVQPLPLRSDQLVHQASDANPFKVTEARRLLEGEVAALAAGLITNEQLSELEATVALMDNPALNHHARERADRAFHMALVAVTQNDVLMSMVETLWDMRYRSALCIYFFQQAREHGVEPAADQHRLILNALSRRDPDAARAAMRAHLVNVTDSLMAATEYDRQQRDRLRVTERGAEFARRARAVP